MMNTRVQEEYEQPKIKLEPLDYSDISSEEETEYPIENITETNLDVKPKSDGFYICSSCKYKWWTFEIEKCVEHTETHSEKVHFEFIKCSDFEEQFNINMFGETEEVADEEIEKETFINTVSNMCQSYNFKKKLIESDIILNRYERSDDFKNCDNSNKYDISRSYSNQYNGEKTIKNEFRNFPSHLRSKHTSSNKHLSRSSDSELISGTTGNLLNHDSSFKIEFKPDPEGICDNLLEQNQSNATHENNELTFPEKSIKASESRGKYITPKYNKFFIIYRNKKKQLITKCKLCRYSSMNKKIVRTHVCNPIMTSQKRFHCKYCKYACDTRLGITMHIKDKHKIDRTLM